MAKEIIQGYEIIKRERVGNKEFVLAHNPNAPSPYATWKCNAGTSEMYWGHYLGDREAAEHDFKRRVRDERGFER